MGSHLTAVARRRAMTTEEVEYSFQGEKVMIPRCAHDEIERLKAELELEKRRRRDLLSGK